jgi:hypothetical protein
MPMYQAVFAEWPEWFAGKHRLNGCISDQYNLTLTQILKSHKTNIFETLSRLKFEGTHEGAAHRNTKDIAVRCTFFLNQHSTNIIATLSLSALVI